MNENIIEAALYLLLIISLLSFMATVGSNGPLLVFGALFILGQGYALYVGSSSGWGNYSDLKIKK